MTIADVEAQPADGGSPQDSWPPPAEYPATFERVHRCKDGTAIPVQVHWTWVEVAAKPLMLTVARDITDRTRAEKVLQEQQQFRRKLRETHVGLARQLTAALHKFQALGRLPNGDGQTDQQTFDEGVRLLREAITDTNRLADDLPATGLDES